MPDIDKQSIKINAYDSSIEITNDPKRKYHRKLDLPPEADISTANQLSKMEYLKLHLTKRRNET